MARPVEKRRYIEEGVVRVVAEKGVMGTTIQDIANAANVSPGLLYRYWKNRDDLAREVFRTHSLALLGKLIVLAAGERDALAKIRVMLEAFIEYADEHPVELKFLLLSQYDLNSSIPKEQSLHRFVRQVVAEGVGQGCLRALDVDLATSILIGVVLQPVIAAIYGNVSLPVRQHVPAIMSAVERALGAKVSSVVQVRA